MLDGFSEERFRYYRDIKALQSKIEEHVKVDRKKLIQFAQEIAEKELRVPNWGPPYFPNFPPENNEIFLRHLLIGNALNFCYTEPSHEKFAVSWTPPGEEEEQLFVGSKGMWAALSRAYKDGLDIYSGRVLKNLTIKDVKHIFRTDAGPLPLISKRWANLVDVGSYLHLLDIGNMSLGDILDVYGDAKFILNFLKSSMTVAYGMDGINTHKVYSSGSVPFRYIHFDKRARLFVVMYEGRARSSEGELETLEGLDAIGPITDYQVPKIFRHFGVLKYSNELSHKVDNKIELPEYSLEEFALRAATYIATEELYYALRYIRDEDISMVELDYLLWSQGRRAEGEHHITLTDNY